MTNVGDFDGKTTFGSRKPAATVSIWCGSAPKIGNMSWVTSRSLDTKGMPLPRFAPIVLTRRRSAIQSTSC